MNPFDELLGKDNFTNDRKQSNDSVSYIETEKVLDIVPISLNEISNISILSDNLIELTFCTYPDYVDFMNLKINTKTLKELSEFYIKNFKKQ
jgi:hypothetical protein